MQAAALASAQQDARNALERLAGLESVREYLKASKARVEEELHINTGIFARQFFRMPGRGRKTSAVNRRFDSIAS